MSPDYSNRVSLLPVSASSWITENLLSTQGEARLLLGPVLGAGLGAGAADLSSISLADTRCGFWPGDCCANSFLKSCREVFFGVIETGPGHQEHEWLVIGIKKK